MLYPTHHLGGIQVGLLFSFLLLSEYYQLWHINKMFVLLIAVILAISGSIYGSEWNDIDSKKSIPAQTHPVMRKVFEFFHVTHRGPISHSILSITLIWFVPGFLVYMYANHCQINVEHSMQNVLLFKILLAFFSVNAIRMFLSFIISFMKSDNKSFSGIKNSMMFLITDDFEYAKKAHFRRMNREDKKKLKYVSLIIALVVSIILPSLSIKEYLILTSIYLVGIWAGSIDHDILDMSTKQGIYLDWKHQIKIEKWMSNTPIVRHFIPENEFKTGTGYETKFVRPVIGFINIILFIVLFIHIIFTLLVK